MKAERIESSSDLLRRPSYRASLDFSQESGRKLARILGAYRFPESDYVPCGISSCRTLHGNGYLVETSDGLETNIGNRCGAKHLGADFKQERNRFRAWERRQRNRAVISEFQNQAIHHRDRVEEAIDQVRDFRRFMRQLEPNIARALTAMGRTEQERLRSPDKLQRDDAKALHEAREVRQSFGQWYREERPTVSDLGLRFPGTAATVFPFREVLVEQLQQPMAQLLAMGQEVIDNQTDAHLDEMRQQIQAAPRLMRDAEEALEKAKKLMAVDPDLFRFLPGVYPSDDD